MFFPTPYMFIYIFISIRHCLTNFTFSFTEKELQGKWRNLRTCFRRELKKQKYGSSGQAARKRRKYVFFDQLLFLLPTLDDRPTTSECSPSQAGNASAESDNDEDSEIMDRPQQSDIGASQVLIETRQPTNKQTQQPDKGATNKKQAKKTETYEQSLLNILKEKKEEPFDEDKAFLLSLVPTFKKLNDSQKLDAKMEFLATLKRLTQPSQSQPSNSFYHMPVGVGYPDYRKQNYNNYNNQNWQPTMTIPLPHTSGSSRESGSMSLDPLSPNEFSDFP